MSTTEEDQWENDVGFFEYMGLPRDDPEGFLAGAYAFSAEEFLDAVFDFLGEDITNDVLRSDTYYYDEPTISSSPEGSSASSKTFPLRCGDNFLEHLYMICPCFVGDVADHHPAPGDYADYDEGDLMFYMEDGEQDEMTSMASLAETVDDEVEVDSAAVDDAVDEVTTAATAVLDEDDDIYDIILRAA
uniref:Uncharacterized protein n=1 Tax=Leersia perrieri TaxID=77586 RepID=A0A0D9VIF8_9ORYZ